MESVDREEEFDHKMHQVESPDSLGSDQGFEKLESASPVSAPDDTALYGYDAPGSQFDKKDEDESEQEMEANREADISEKNIVMSPFEHASGEQDHEHTPDSGAEDVDKFGHEDAERVEEEFGDDDLDEGERDKPEKGLLVDFDEPQSTKPYETDLYTSPSDTMQQLQEAILEPEEREPEQEEPTPQLSAPEIPTDPLEAEMSHEVPEVSAASAVDSELAATDTLQAGAEQESTEPSVTPLCEVSESTPAPYEFSPRSEMPGEALVAEEAEEAIESVKKEEEEEKEAHDVPALKVDAPADEVTSSSSKEKCCIFNVENWDPRFVDLVYWRDLKKSGVCFGSTLLVLLMVSYFSLMLVLTYASIALLTVTISFYVYKKAVQAVQKSSEGHPFKEFLDKDVTVPADRAKCVADLVVAHVNPILTDLRRIFLVEHLVDTVKFGAVLWVMTYICYWFDGYVLMIMGWVTLFTIPKIYEAHKEKIDCYLEKAQEKAKEIVSKVKERIPIGKKEKSQ
ncbi:PREDICTED: reticulon-4-like [Priapulus caudatus]|uniref:Reticulon-like protein n=1 Tax=Priapulus caudatus TaxID=37621 RepID=A0ABM1EF74_PRICU|nr:PREDICTED: reticulon-4-like [Priapulus caudatus]